MTYRQYMATLSCQMSCMMTGACFYWLSPLLTQETTEIKLSGEEGSWVIAAVEAGVIISPIPAGLLVNRWGRKPVLYLTFPITLASWIIILCNTTVVSLCIVRIIQGLALGIVYGVAPMYVAEIAEPNIRGVLSGYFQTMFSAGMLFAYLTGPFLSYNNYVYACASLALIFIVTFTWMPETPYYYLMSGDKARAKESLIWLRGRNDVEEELNDISNSIINETKEEKGTWVELFTTYRKPTIVITSVCFVKMMSGISAINTYLTETLSESGDFKIPSHFITIIIGFLMMLSNAFSSYLTDAIGRKPLLYMSTSGAIIFNATAGTYYLLQYLEYEGIYDYNWVSYSSMAAYCILGSVGLNPLVQTLQAELFPSNIRGIAGAYTTCIGTIFVFITLKQYKTVENIFGIYMNYFLFSVYSVIGSIGMFMFLKETAGKTLGEISP